MFGISDKKYEELRLILQEQNSRVYTFEEAKEIGDELIDFYNLLAELAKEDDATTNDDRRA
jgi:hypothetical protein